MNTTQFIRNYEIIQFTTAWLELEDIMLNRVSQKRDKRRIISFIYGIQNNWMRVRNGLKEGCLDHPWPRVLEEERKKLSCQGRKDR